MKQITFVSGVMLSIFLLNSCGIFQSSSLDIPAERLDTIQDKRNGQVYRTIKIGDQWWMMENLNIGRQIDGKQEQKDNGTIEKYCYKGDTANCKKYGGLYQWSEATAYPESEAKSEIRDVCPTGWHLPTDKEWQKLEMQMGMHSSQADDKGKRGIKVGDKLKIQEKCAQDKYCNRSGFSILMGGKRDTKGYFYGIRVTGNYWTATPQKEDKAWSRHFISSSPKVEREPAKQENAFSIRCIKNK